MSEINKFVVMELPPHTRHTTIESAKAEAEREFGKCGMKKEFVVVQVVAKIKSQTIPNWEETPSTS